MNKKVSGSKTVLVDITTTGQNYLPYIEDLRDRYIKFVDCVIMAQATPNVSKTMIVDANLDALSLTLAQKSGNVYFSQNMPLRRYDIASNLGERLPIMQKLSMQNSYITCTDSSLVGKTILLVFWYDEPQYSKPNSTDKVKVDGFGISIVTNTGKNSMPDNRTMVGKRFRRFYLTYPATTPTMAPGITSTQANSLYITFQKGNYALLENLPLPLLYQLGYLQTLDLANIVFDFTYSYVQVGGVGQTGFTGKEVFLNAEYEA